MKNRWLAVLLVVCGYFVFNGSSPLSDVAWLICAAVLLFWFWPRGGVRTWHSRFYFAPSGRA